MKNNQSITFTWLGSHEKKSFRILVPAGTSFTVDWGNNITETFTGTEYLETYTQPTAYSTEKEYTVTITAKQNCSFIELDVASTELVTIDLSKATSLNVLYCENNPLTILTYNTLSIFI